MANDYCQSSSFMKLTQEQLKLAEPIIERVTDEIKDADGYFGMLVTVEENGLWFHDTEGANPEHLADLVQALLDELKIDKPFHFSWAFVCDNPRINEFGGGACAVKRGCKPYWVDAMNLARDYKFVNKKPGRKRKTK